MNNQELNKACAEVMELQDRGYEESRRGYFLDDQMICFTDEWDPCTNPVHNKVVSDWMLKRRPCLVLRMTMDKDDNTYAELFSSSAMISYYLLGSGDTALIAFCEAAAVDVEKLKEETKEKEAAMAKAKDDAIKAAEELKKDKEDPEKKD